MNRGTIVTYCLFCALLCVSSCGVFRAPQSPEHLAAAERYSSKGEYAKAIREYEAHKQWRLSKESRPEWENPYFYDLLIGDLYLRNGDDEAAKKSYLNALQEGIDQALVVDRIRALASWYSERKEFDQAITLLSEHEALDPILMNLSLDRIARDSLLQ